MKRFIKNWLERPERIFEYILTLAVYVGIFWFLSFFIIYYQWTRGALFRYIANIVLIILVLIEDWASHFLSEWMYQKIKKDNMLKRYFRKRLLTYRWQPSIKASLYLYYIICLIAGRVLHLGPSLFPNSSMIQFSRSYFDEMYYVLILLVATDKFKDYILKENKYREKYYRRYAEEKVQAGDLDVD